MGIWRNLKNLNQALKITEFIIERVSLAVLTNNTILT
mgnify:FL=1